jgi:hypothetical protein
MFVTVVANDASSPIAAANSLRVSSSSGAEPTSAATALSVYSSEYAIALLYAVSADPAAS